MKTLKRLGAALGILAAGLTAPIANPVQTQAKVADNGVKTDDKQSVPAAPTPQTSVTFAVRETKGGRVSEIERGLRSPGFGPPAIAYRMAARSGWGTHKRVTKVRTHKARRC